MTIAVALLLEMIFVGFIVFLWGFIPGGNVSKLLLSGLLQILAAIVLIYMKVIRKAKQELLVQTFKDARHFKPRCLGKNHNRGQPS